VPLAALRRASLFPRFRLGPSILSHTVLNRSIQTIRAVMISGAHTRDQVIEYYSRKDADVDVDIVTYGPGLQMLRADT